jgi:hypothetical protein
MATSSARARAVPRQAIDAGPVYAAGLYHQQLRPGLRLLDLCASWASHLPPELVLSHVAGQGMNEAELAANTRLDERWVQDLNSEPGWGRGPS